MCFLLVWPIMQQLKMKADYCCKIKRIDDEVKET